jgi:hypothetical protein
MIHVHEASSMKASPSTAKHGSGKHRGRLGLGSALRGVRLHSTRLDTARAGTDTALGPGVVAETSAPRLCKYENSITVVLVSYTKPRLRAVSKGLPVLRWTLDPTRHSSETCFAPQFSSARHRQCLNCINKCYLHLPVRA